MDTTREEWVVERGMIGGGGQTGSERPETRGPRKIASCVVVIVI
jgi:hypothetical protein